MEKVKLYNGSVTILFEPRKHKYLHEDNSKILSVSKVKDVLNKDALVWWASHCAAAHVNEHWDIGQTYNKAEKIALLKEAYFKHNDVKTQKAKTGKGVHGFAEQFVKGEKPSMPEDELIRNGANAFLKWWNEADFIPVYTERIVYSKKLDIAGRGDLVVKKKQNGKYKYHVVDYKAVSMYKKAKFYEEDKYPDGFVIDERTGEKVKYPIFDEPIIQVSAYRGFLIEELKKDFGESYVIRFDQEFGDFDVTPLSEELQDQAYKTFSHLVPVRHYLDKYGVKLK